MQFAGEFEIHATVRPEGPDWEERLRAWAAPRRLKSLHILLDRGRTVSQPMLTSGIRGTLSTAQAASRTLCADLVTAGFSVVRVKIEAATTNDDIPQLDSNDPDQTGSPTSLRAEAERYFEHHVKLLLAEKFDTESLAVAVAQHSAHLSRNTFRHREDGQCERFVTQRATGCGQIRARQKLHALVELLQTWELSILETEEEYVVFDSNLALDADWIATEANV